jgi:hypothetical protein
VLEAAGKLLARETATGESAKNKTAMDALTCRPKLP